MAFRVSELMFVEQDQAWAVSLQLPQIGPPLAKDQVLVAGTRTWKVGDVYDAPAGFVGARLDGSFPLTRGLILRVSDEPIAEEAYIAHARLLVRLARAFRNADIDGVLARVMAKRAAGNAGGETRAVAKSALMGKHLVESGATDEELTEAAAVLGIGDEL